MSDLIKTRQKAQRTWERLQRSRVPIIYIGAASCGRAAGALDVLKAVEQTLKKKKLKARSKQDRKRRPKKELKKRLR